MSCIKLLLTYLKCVVGVLCKYILDLLIALLWHDQFHAYKVGFIVGRGGWDQRPNMC